MKIIKFITAATAAILLAGGVYAQDLDTVEANYNKAVELVQAKDFAGAIPMLESVINDGFDLGDDAIEYVKGAQKLVPTCYFQLGGRNFNTNVDEAIVNFEKAAELSELYGNMDILGKAKMWIGRSYTKKGADAFNNKDYATAAEIFAQGYAADPSNTDLALNLAKSYGEMGIENPEYMTKAMEVYDSIIALTHSKFAEAVAQAKKDKGYFQTVNITKLVAAKDFDTAYAQIDEILATDPDNAAVNFILLQAATNQQNWAKVIANGEKAAGLQDSDEMKSEAYFLLGAAYQNTDNKAKAIEAYRKVAAGAKVDTAKAQIAALQK